MAGSARAWPSRLSVSIRYSTVWPMGSTKPSPTAVREAVKAVLTRSFDQPRVTGSAAPRPANCRSGTSPNRADGWPETWEGIRSALRWTAEQGHAGWLWLCQVCGSVSDQVAETTSRFRDNFVRLLVAGGCALLRARWILAPILAAAALAGLTGIAAYQLGPWVAAGVSGAGSLGTALAKPGAGSWLALGLAVADVGGVNVRRNQSEAPLPRHGGSRQRGCSFPAAEPFRRGTGDHVKTHSGRAEFRLLVVIEDGLYRYDPKAARTDCRGWRGRSYAR